MDTGYALVSKKLYILRIAFFIFLLDSVPNLKVDRGFKNGTKTSSKTKKAILKCRVFSCTSAPPVPQTGQKLYIKRRVFFLSK